VLEFYTLQSAGLEFRLCKEHGKALSITQSYMLKMKYPLQTSLEAYYKGYILYGIYKRNRLVGLLPITIKHNALWFHLLASPTTMLKDVGAREDVLRFLLAQQDCMFCSSLQTSINADNVVGIAAVAELGLKPLDKFQHLEYTFFIYEGYTRTPSQVL
jgi:hypothetical protein